MTENKTYYIKRSSKNHRVTRPSQTGFSSPATHYTEPRIDLNEALVSNPSATFYVRVADNSFANYGIKENDVLIIDKSLTPNNNQLILAIKDDAFSILKIENKQKETLQVWGVITYIIKAVK